jgi:hypothetical protein
MTKTLNQIIFFPHHHQNIFFSNIGNQNIFFRKKPYIEEHITQLPKEKVQKGQITIYKTLHRKLKIEQHESH